MVWKRGTDASTSSRTPKDDARSLDRTRKPMSIDAMFSAVEAENAADLAEAEREAEVTGKEPFDWERLSKLLGVSTGGQAQNEHSLRSRYYLLYPEIRTLAEFSTVINENEVWNE